MWWWCVVEEVGCSLGCLLSSSAMPQMPSKYCLCACIYTHMTVHFVVEEAVEVDTYLVPLNRFNTICYKPLKSYINNCQNVAICSCFLVQFVQICTYLLLHCVCLCKKQLQVGHSLHNCLNQILTCYSR